MSQLLLTLEYVGLGSSAVSAVNALTWSGELTVREIKRMRLRYTYEETK
jgi:homoserine kinase